MGKHTPGPWEFGKRGRTYQRIDGGRQPAGDAGGFAWYGLAKVVVFVDDDTSPHPVGEANARLIAAAPELLEALLALRATCLAAINSGDWKVDGACDPDMDFKRANTAIAKATP